MKMLSIYAVCLALTVCNAVQLAATENYTEKFERALAEGNIAKVERLLNIIELEVKTVQEQKSLYGRFLNQVQAAYETHKSLKIFNNKWDAAKFLLGLPFTASGLFLLGLGAFGVAECEEIDDEKRLYVGLYFGGSSAIAALGSYWLYRGWHCSAQQKKLQHIEKIRNAVNEAALAAKDQ